MEININKTLKFARFVCRKVDEMIEMALISYPENETFKKLVEIKNERLMNAFKPGKIFVVLELENQIVELKQISSRPDVWFSSNRTAILFLYLGTDSSESLLDATELGSNARSGNEEGELAEDQADVPKEQEKKLIVIKLNIER
ncbi:hypothetical protein Tco_0560820 [Tanacetum coccineum]